MMSRKGKSMRTVVKGNNECVFEKKTLVSASTNEVDGDTRIGMVAISYDPREDSPWKVEREYRKYSKMFRR